MKPKLTIEEMQQKINQWGELHRKYKAMSSSELNSALEKAEEWIRSNSKHPEIREATRRFSIIKRILNTKTEKEINEAFGIK